MRPRYLTNHHRCGTLGAYACSTEYAGRNETPQVDRIRLYPPLLFRTEAPNLQRSSSHAAGEDQRILACGNLGPFVMVADRWMRSRWVTLSLAYISMQQRQMVAHGPVTLICYKGAALRTLATRTSNPGSQLALDSTVNISCAN